MFALDLLNQFQSYNGTLLAAGKIYVYKLGRTELAPVYGDHNGATVIANPVILDDQGMAEIYLNDAFNYTIVVFDAYGQEQFSRDIYPSGMGKGESIGTQLYEGIDPIVVNNDVYAISANTTKLGVQDPLYFVQDDEERVIIGFSGHTDVPPGTMNESAFGYEDGQITSYNGSAFSAGLNYVAGDNIVIDGNEIALDSAITLVDQSYTKGMQLDVTEQQFTNLTSNNGSILDASGLYVSDLNMENAANLSKQGLAITGTGSRLIVSNDMSDIYGDNHFEIYGYQESGDGVSAMHLGGNDLIVEHGENGFITASYSLTGACQSAVSALNTITATSGNYYPMEGNPSGFLTAHQDISDKLDTTAFSTVSGDFLTAVPSEYITENTLQSGLSSKLDSTAFSTVSGYFLTAHQSLDGLMSANLLEISDNKITGYNGTAFAGQGGGVSGDFTLVEGNGIQLTDDPIAQTTTISVSGDYATHDDLTSKQDSLTYGYHDTAISSIDNSALYDNSAHARITTLAGRISDLSSNKLDTTAFSDVSGSFLTGVPGTYLQNTDLTIASGKVTEISGIPLSAGTTYTSPSGTIRIAGDTLEGTTSAVVGDSITDVVDNGDVAQWMVLTALPNYPYSEYLVRRSDWEPDHEIFCVYGNWNYTYYEYPPVNETFSVPLVREGYPLTQIMSNGTLSAIKDNKQVVELALKSDLTPYQLTADMTAYQPVGDYLTTADSANFYTTANESGFISEVPDTYLQNTDLSTTDGKVTAISGIPLSAGGDVPEGVMVESGLEYNAVNEISGYNGSAIAQYGHEAQWLQHDDTLVHASNSAQYALGVNLSAVAQLLGVDETVLWEGSAPLDQSCLVNGTRETATLSEPLSSFNKIRIYAVWNPWIGNFTGCNMFEYPGTNQKGGYIMNDCTNQGFIAGGSWSANETTFKLVKHWQANYPAAKETSDGLGGIFKIVGIGRKQ